MATKQTKLLATAAILALSLAGCNSSNTRNSNSEGSDSAPFISMNSARTSKQLLTGFYNVENGAWRWTGKNFSVALGVPAGAATKGGKLVFRLVLPGSSVQLLHSVTLSAKIKDSTLAPETYSTAGEHVYTRDLAARDLAISPVRVDFTLDKAMPPGPVDIRELGVIATEISLASK